MARKKAVVTALCTALLLTAVCFVMLHRPHGDTVVIKQDGRVLYTLDLSKEKDREIVVEYQGRQNVIAIQDGDVYMKEADCPDHVCMDTGRLSKAGVPIVCLPNRLMVRYADGSSGEDADGAAG